MKLASNNTVVLDQPSDMRELIETLERAMNTWERAPIAVRRLYYNLVAANAAVNAGFSYEWNLDLNESTVICPAGWVCVINKRLLGLRLWHNKIVIHREDGGTTIVDLRSGDARDVMAVELASQDFPHNER